MLSLADAPWASHCVAGGCVGEAPPDKSNAREIVFRISRSSADLDNSTYRQIDPGAGRLGDFTLSANIVRAFHRCRVYGLDPRHTPQLPFPESIVIAIFRG